MSDAISVDRIAAGPWSQNCYVVAAERDDAVVIDPGGEAGSIADLVASRGLSVRAILATHAHHDHVGAAGELADLYGAPFGLHSCDAEQLRRVNLCRFAFHRLEPVALPPVGIDLAHEHELRFGALRLTVLHTPGHSPGSVCFDVGGELITGDTLMTTEPGPSDLPGSDRDLLAASVRDLAHAYPAETTIHPGHGDSATIGEALLQTAMHGAGA